jgi:hypothetical protein
VKYRDLIKTIKSRSIGPAGLLGALGDTAEPVEESAADAAPRA